MDIPAFKYCFIGGTSILTVYISSKMQKLLFTGGTGFLGKNVMPLLTKQYQVTTYGITPDDMIKANLAKEVPELDQYYDVVLHVEGMTRRQLTDLIKQKLIADNYIKDPVVTVQFMNFKVSVMGEVQRPGSFNITGDRITLLEALSMAGDLTIYGRRDRVAVIREKDGKRTILYHDLRSSDIFNSPCYYLQQNDIVYVEPNKTRAVQSGINQNNSASVWLASLSVLASLVSVIVTLSK